MSYLNKDQQREYQRNWVAARRSEFFADKTCIDCGSSDQLELDHLDPDKKVSHRIWSWSQERRDIETAKCVVRCRDCHIAKTAKDKRRHLVHGTYGYYTILKCRCLECRTWKKFENAKRYIKC